MTVTGELAEIIRLSLILGTCAAFGVWAVRRYVRGESSSVTMAASIAALEKENTTLKAEIVQLRAGFAGVLEENHALRCEIDKLKAEVAGLRDTLRSTERQLDDWRAAAIAAKKP